MEHDNIRWAGATHDAVLNRAGVRMLAMQESISRALAAAAEIPYGVILDIVLEAMESPFGVVGFIDDTGDLVCPSMTTEIYGPCAMPGASNVFPRAAWAGVWGHALITGQTHMANEPRPVPNGHVPVTRALSAPFVHHGQVLGVLTVANKPSAYDDGDVRMLEGLASYMAPVLHARLQHARVSEGLRQSEARLSGAFEHAAVGMVYADLNGVLTRVNPRFAAMLGYAPRELVGVHFSAVTHPSAQDGDATGVRDVATGRAERYQTEKRYVRKDGRSTWAETVVSLVRDQAGSPDFLVAVIADITPRIEAQSQLGRMRALLASVTEAATEAIFVKDRRGRYLAMNPAGAALLGVPREQIVGATDADLMPADEARAVRSEDRAAMASDQPIAAEAVRTIGGVRRHMEVTKGALRDEAGEIVGTFGIARDISEIRRAEAEIRASEERFRLFYEHAPIAYQSLDSEGRILAVNGAWLNMVGRTSDEVVGRPISDFLTEASKAVLPTRFAQFAAAGVVRGAEFEFVHRDGHVIVVSVDGNIGLDPDGGFLRTHCVLHDITERKRLEAERLASVEALQQSQKLEAIGTFAAGMAHEINNPVNSIINYAQILVDRATGDAQGCGTAAEILAEAERVASIVRDLLAFARQEALPRSLANMRDLVDGTLAFVRTALRKESIHLAVDVAADLPMINCRTEQIRQVLLNLINNGRDALNVRYPGADPNKRMRLTVDAADRPDGLVVRVVVVDHGYGIPAEIAQRVFDPFFTTKTRDKGTGLGLAVSHGIVQDHRGSIRHEPAEDGGTRFVLELPAVD